MESDCRIILDDGAKIDGITIGAPKAKLGLGGLLQHDISLRFLSVVDIQRIPLHIALGSPSRVYTSHEETQTWFRDALLRTQPDDPTRPWWEVVSTDSPPGILVAVPQIDDDGQPKAPRVTELLFYVSNVEARQCPPTPPPSSPSITAVDEGKPRPGSELKLFALPLSSDLLYRPPEDGPSPPASPTAEKTEIEAKFLPPAFAPVEAPVHQPPVRKRKSANDVFDEANERRKKARRKGGEGVSAAAANRTTDSQIPTLQHRRSGSISLQSRPHSRSPSLGPSRPATAAQPAPKKSTLSRVQSVNNLHDATTDIESKNKDAISRIVMAGMRLYGLSQSKGRRSRSDSTASSPAVDTTFEEREATRKNDEEFKLIYHQVYKGTCFAFRASIADKALQPLTDAVRDVADKLLSIFCQDPLDTGGGFGGVREETDGKFNQFDSPTPQSKRGVA
ncbi:hypothetical protein BDY17DRAFT_328359 [Neohortaea acidophila]|uniref:Sld7 C-terminal domain-containing protein n=1 Tax=Neohortaea acidophila TaxID=245834 RepID=A0A6A6PGD6_9PEZI|nr:uncharacterized protein BDY17DRAFT_328359 [Neohortaea acidophila]KAF2478846.1 hypothetical protein BDY17DRAFT_328359 [Neohortaea acidophila]